MIPGSANPLLLNNATSSGGYQIERSLRFNSSDSAYLSRTPSTAGNRKTWTWAGWVKRSKSTAAGGVAAYQPLFEASGSSVPGARTSLMYNGDQLDFFTDNATSSRLIATQVFRDFSAWQHVVLSVDTTQATAANRVRIFINGTQVTTFSTSSYPSQNLDTAVNTTTEHRIGKPYDGFYFDGYLADIHFIDGQALTPSSFGEFDANNVWQPKAYTGTFSGNSFHLDFADNSAATATALGKDTSGNGNNWTPSNFTVGLASISSIYSPPIGFQLWNDGFNTSGISNVSFTNSNKTVTADNTSEKTVITTTAKSSGKWYVEFVRFGAIDTSDDFWGLASNNSDFPGSGATAGVGSTTGRNVFRSYTSGSSVTPNIPSYSSGSVCQIAVDFDAKKVWWGVDNVWSSNGNPSTGANPTFSNWTGSPTWYAGQRLYFSGAGANLNSGNATVSRQNDSLVDSPSSPAGQTDSGAGGTVVGNYCTLNPLDKGNVMSLSDGNLYCTSSAANHNLIRGTIGVSTGKWYWEVTAAPANNDNIGVANRTIAVNGAVLANPGDANSAGIYSGSYGSTSTLGFALDCDSGKLFISENGTWKNSGNPVTGANPWASSLTSGPYFPAANLYNFNGVPAYIWNFGQRPFAYTAPSGFKALCTTNLPTPTIANGATAMDVKLYTGNGSTQTISGLNLSGPDLVWIKARSAGSTDHCLFDTIRGATKGLHSNQTIAEWTDTATLTAFNADGFTLAGHPYTNGNGTTYAAWCWDASSSTVTNTQGSITSQVRANASAGFSIVSYTGSGVNATIGHGLGVAPQMVIVKSRVSTANTSWAIYHTGTGAGNWTPFSTDATIPGAGAWNNTAPTSSVFSVGTFSIVNENTKTYVAYCFAPVAGYSSFGSYTGNGSADGPFVYTGMRPRYLCIKSTSFADQWIVFDSARNASNVVNLHLHPNLANNESSLDWLDFTSNGFKIRTTYSTVNQSSGSFIYFAFAENPFSLARAR